MIEVRISDYMQVDGISVWVVLKHEGESRRVLHLGDNGSRTWDEAPQAVTVEPTMTLENDAGRALLDALLRHYQGATDMHTVRADLLHERGRVDKLTDAVIAIARKEPS